MENLIINSGDVSNNISPESSHGDLFDDGFGLLELFDENAPIISQAEQRSDEIALSNVPSVSPDSDMDEDKSL